MRRKVILMCQYCDNKYYQTGCGKTFFGQKIEGNLVDHTFDGGHMVLHPYPQEDPDDQYIVKIDFCPFCGRKMTRSSSNKEYM